MRPIAVFCDSASEGKLLVVAIRDAGFDCMRVRSIDRWSVVNPLGIAVIVLEQDNAGLELVRQLRREHPGVSAVCLIEEASTEVSVAAIAAGAEGVVARRAPIQRAVQAVRAAAEGRALVDVALLRKLVQFFPDTLAGELDAKDQFLLRLVVEGTKPERIARQLHCSVRTAYRRMNEIYNRIGVRTREEAIYLAGRGDLLNRRPTSESIYDID